MFPEIYLSKWLCNSQEGLLLLWRNNYIESSAAFKTGK